MSASHQSGDPVARTTCLAAAGLLAAAGGLHLAALPGHLNASTVAGAFFAVTAVAQLLGAMVVAARPSSRTLLAVIAGNVSVLTLWAMSRTTGLPTGGELGVKEPFGLLDGFAAAAEVLVVVAATAGLATMVRGAKGTGRSSGGRRPALVLALTWVISGGAGLAVADVGHHGGAGHAHRGTTSGEHRHQESDPHLPVVPGSSREGFNVGEPARERSHGAPVGSGHSHDTSVLDRPVTAAGCPVAHDCTGHSH